MSWTQSFRLLREANFRRLFVGRLTSSFGSGVASLALTFALLDSGASAGTLGLVLATSTIPQIFLTLAGGVLGDRMERRFLLIGTDIVQAITQLAIGVLFLTHHASIWALMALRLVYGAATAFHRPAATSVVVDVVGIASLQEARSFLSMGVSGSRLMAPALAGILIAAFNPGWALVIDAATFAVSAVALARLTMPRRAVVLSNSMKSDFLHGWHEFTSRPWAVKMIASFGLYQATALPAVFVLGPILAKQEWHGASSWALVMSAMGVGDVLGGAVTLRWKPERLVLASNLLWALDLPLLIVLGVHANSVAWAIPTATLFGISLSAGTTLWLQALASEVPPESLARVTSYDEVGSVVLNPLGFALIGLVAASIGNTSTYAIVIGLHLVMLAGLLLSRDINAIRRETAAPPR